MTTVLIQKSLTTFFTERLSRLPSDQPGLTLEESTRAYLVSIFARYRTARDDMSRDSITLLYSGARERQSFAEFQALGDWLFYAQALYPESLRHASPDFYQTAGQLAYIRCFNLINRQWRCFEQLADQYSAILNVTKEIILK